MAPTRNDEITSALVARAQAGDGAAITAIYARYATPLYRFILRRVSDPTVAEDLLQDVFVGMLAGLPSYKDRGYPIGSWLYRMAACRVIDWQRVTARRRVAPLEYAGQQASADDLDGADTAADRVAQQRALATAMTTLTDRQAAVIRLRFFADLPIAEVAQRLALTPLAVKALQHRGLVQLRTQLSPYHPALRRDGATAVFSNAKEACGDPGSGAIPLPARSR